MDQEIDLRLLVSTILKDWHWIAASTALFVLFAFVISAVLPDAYESTALVAITEPSQLVNFVTGFENVQEIVPRPLRAYPELAMSDQLLERVVSNLTPMLSESMTQTQLAALLTAESGDDLSLIRLRVRHEDREISALIANTWAAEFVSMANEIYGGSGSSQLTSLESQLAQLSTELDAAEQELVDFQAHNRLEIIDSDLQALKTQRSVLLEKQASIGDLIEVVSALRHLLLNGSVADVNFADQFTAMSLQMSAFRQGDAEEPGAITLQIDSNDVVLTTTSREDQIALLDDLEDTLAMRLAAIEEEKNLLEPQILVLQGEREVFAVSQSQLLRDRDTTQEAYLLLARRVEEERIAAQDIVEAVRLASEASVPNIPSGPGSFLIVTLGTVSGLGAGLLGVLLRSWWRGQT